MRVAECELHAQAEKSSAIQLAHTKSLAADITDVYPEHKKNQCPLVARGN
jgi:hypothetical protein